MRRTPVLAVVCAAAAAAPGQIVYDGLTGLPITTHFSFGPTEVAEDTTLGPGPLTVDRVTLWVRNPHAAFPIAFNVRISIYQDAGGQPGVLLTTAATGLSMTPLEQLLLDLDLPNAPAPSPSLWISYAFEPVGSPTLYPNVAFTGEPVVGSTSPGFMYFSQGTWHAGGSSGSLGVQIHAASTCYADCNADAQLTVADFGCFQTKFVAGDPYADCNGNGSLTVADFGCFQTAFVAGCP